MAQRARFDALWTSSAIVTFVAISTATACGTNAEKSAATGADAAVEASTSPLDGDVQIDEADGAPVRLHSVQAITCCLRFIEATANVDTTDGG
jgi:hypothetical protein